MAFSQIRFDATTEELEDNTGNWPEWEHPCNGYQRLLLVWITTGNPFWSAAINVTGVDCSGRAMTQKAEETFSHMGDNIRGHIEAWYLKGPKTGTNVITISGVGADFRCIAQAVSYMGIHPDTPLGAVFTDTIDWVGNSWGVSPNTSNPEDWAAGGGCGFDDGCSVNLTTGTERQAHTLSNWASGAIGDRPSTGATTLIGGSSANNIWHGGIGFALKAAPRFGGARAFFIGSKIWEGWQKRTGLLVPKGFGEGIWKPRDLGLVTI